MRNTFENYSNLVEKGIRREVAPVGCVATQG